MAYLAHGHRHPLLEGLRRRQLQRDLSVRMFEVMALMRAVGASL